MNPVQVAFDSFELKSVLNELARTVDHIDYSEPLAELGNLAVFAAVERLTVTKTDPDGSRWRPWSPAYARRVEASGNVAHTLLYKSGEMTRQVDADVTGPDEVTVFTETPYANRQQQDRAFLGLSVEQEDEAAEILAQHVADFISEAA